MSIFVTVDIFNLLRNRIAIPITTDAYVVSPGEFSINNIEFTAGASDGTQLAFSNFSGGQSWVWDFVSFPTGFELPAFSGGTIIDWLAEDILPTLLATHAYLTDDYDLSVSGPTLILTSKLKSSDYNLSMTSNGVSASLHNATVGSPEEIADDLLIGCNIDYRGVGESDWKTIYQNLPVSDGQSLLFLDKVLSSADAIDTRPQMVPLVVSRLEGSVLECRLRLSERYGIGGSSFYSEMTSVIFYCLPGGVSEQDYKTLDLENTFDQTPFCWLTNMRDNFRVKAGEKHWAHFFMYPSTQTVSIKCVFTYTDGSTSATKVRATITSAVSKEIVQIPLGYGAFSDLADVGKTINSWRVWISDLSGNDISGTLFFTLDDHVDADAFSLVFRNAMGVYEVRYFYGIQQKNFENTKQIIGRALPADVSRSDRQLKTYNPTYQNEWVLNTGSLLPHEMEDLIDVVNSEDVFRVVEIGATEYLVPVIVEQNGRNLHATRSYLTNDMQVVIRDADINRNYSNGRYSV